MADKKYVSIINNGSVALYVKDLEAHQEIADIKSSMTGAMHYIGKSATELTEGDYEGPWTIDGIVYDNTYFTFGSSSLGTQVYIRDNTLDEYFGDVQGHSTNYYAYVNSLASSTQANIPTILYCQDSEDPGATGDNLYYKNNGSFEIYHLPSGIASVVYHSRTENSIQLNLGSVAVYKKNYKELEYIWGHNGWSEFGSTGSLKALAFKDSAKGNVTAAGSNAASSVTLTGGSTSKLATTSITPVNGTESVSAVSSTSSKLATTTIKGVAGTETVSKVTKTSSKLVTTTITGVGGSSTVHDTPTLTKTSITPVGGTATVHDTPTLNKSSIGSASGWNTGSLPEMQYNQATETLTFNAGTLPTLTVTSTQVGTGLTAGIEKTFATAGTAVQVGTGLTAGTEKTFATAASSSTTVATGTASSEGSGADIVTGVSITDKTVATAASSNTTVATGSTSDTGSGAAIVTSVTATAKTVAKAGTAVTVATGSVAANGGGATVVTASPTGGTAAAQTFTGSAVSVTVS